MATTGFIPYLATLAAVLMLIGFTFRNPLKLRAFAILGNLTFIAYYVLISDVPLWTAIISAAAIIAVNVYMMWQILNDRKMFRLSAEELMLFSRLPGLTPGQYKSLLEISEWHNPQVSLPLTILGEMPKALYYVLEGQVEVNRDGKRFAIGPHAFIGELAFLRQKPATATTFGNAGALIVSWEYAALRSLMSSNDGIRKAFDTMLSIDMAEKMAKSATPHLQEQEQAA
jgi:CRP-like cAMP-binding protein